jgi:hypothetical protein
MASSGSLTKVGPKTKKQIKSRFNFNSKKSGKNKKLHKQKT